MPSVYVKTEYPYVFPLHNFTYFLCRPISLTNLPYISEHVWVTQQFSEYKRWRNSEWFVDETGAVCLQQAKWPVSESAFSVTAECRSAKTLLAFPFFQRPQRPPNSEPNNVMNAAGRFPFHPQLHLRFEKISQAEIPRRAVHYWHTTPPQWKNGRIKKREYK